MTHIDTENQDPANYRPDNPLGHAALLYLTNRARPWPSRRAQRVELASLILGVAAALLLTLVWDLPWAIGVPSGIALAFALYCGDRYWWGAWQHDQEAPYRDHLVTVVSRHETDRPLEQRAETIYSDRPPPLVKRGIAIAADSDGPPERPNAALTYCRAGCQIVNDAEAGHRLASSGGPPQNSTAAIIGKLETETEE